MCSDAAAHPEPTGDASLDEYVWWHRCLCRFPYLDQDEGDQQRERDDKQCNDLAVAPLVSIVSSVGLTWDLDLHLR